ncbi:MAG: tRNA pseudouridine(55) synthase TruB [bacterium]
MSITYNGVLNINKPEGITSFDVVAGIKRLAKVKKIGHTGTLDPMASGVLLVCLGKATKIVPFLMETTKEYRATLHLGVTTDTLDATGTVLQKTKGIVPSLEQVREAVNSFVGEIVQVPPMFSALRHQGKRLYELAREGIEVERKPREVHIYHLTIQRYEPPYLTFDVSCSKGTYIRTLCADIGQRLGTGGHMSSLQRLRSGGMTIEQATPFAAITRETISEILAARLLSLDDVLKFLPVIQITTEAERKVYHGMPLSPGEVVRCPESFRKGDLFRGHTPDDHLLGIFEALTDVTGIHAGIQSSAYPDTHIHPDIRPDVHAGTRAGTCADIHPCPKMPGLCQTERENRAEGERGREVLWFKPKRLLADIPSAV